MMNRRLIIGVITASRKVNRNAKMTSNAEVLAEVPSCCCSIPLPTLLLDHDDTWPLLAETCRLALHIMPSLLLLLMMVDSSSSSFVVAPPVSVAFMADMYVDPQCILPYDDNLQSFSTPRLRHYVVFSMMKVDGPCRSLPVLA